MLAAAILAAYVHWCEPKNMVSPNQAWELAVVPHCNGNSSPVLVRKRGGGRANIVLNLERDAMVYWAGASRLLIIDHPVTMPRRVLLFRLGTTGTVTRLRATPDLDAEIRARVLRALGRTETVEFYIPTFGSWTGPRLVLRLGGTAVYKKASPSMTQYCYRVIVDSRTAKVEKIVKESTREHSTKCRFFP